MGDCVERLEAGELPGLTFALHDRERFQGEMVSHGRNGHVVILKWLASVPPFPKCLPPRPTMPKSLEMVVTGWFLWTTLDYSLVR